MNPRLMTVARSDSLREAGRLVGVVSATDVLVYLSDETVDPEHGFSHLFASDGELSEPRVNHLGEGLVEELMTPAALMQERGIQRLVVVEGEVSVGVLSSSDLVRWCSDTKWD
jgi:CBS domain-containing protein